MVERVESRRDGNKRAKMRLDDWIALINNEWRKSVPAIIKTGQHLQKAKRALGHGDMWEKMVGAELVPGKLDFDKRIAQMLMKIAKHKTLSKTKNFSFLPPVYTTLHELSAIPPDQLQGMIEDGRVHPKLKGSEAKTLRAGNILVGEFAETLLSLCRFIEQYGETADEEVLDIMNYEVDQKFGRRPADLREWFIPRLSAMFDKMDERYLAEKYEGSLLTERDGRRCYKNDEAHTVEPTPAELVAYAKEGADEDSQVCIGESTADAREQETKEDG